MLNILPPELKRQNKLKNVYFGLKRTILLIFIILLMPTIFLIGNYFLFKNIMTSAQVEDPTSQSQQKSIDETKNNISSFNSLRRVAFFVLLKPGPR